MNDISVQFFTMEFIFSDDVTIQLPREFTIQIPSFMNLLPQEQLKQLNTESMHLNSEQIVAAGISLSNTVLIVTASGLIYEMVKPVSVTQVYPNNMGHSLMFVIANNQQLHVESKFVIAQSRKLILCT